MKRIFISAGESSGDLHGANLVKALKKIDPSLTFYGVAGPAMRQEGVIPLLPMEQFQVIGFTPVLRSFPKIVFQTLKIRRELLSHPPDLAIFIDYPGLHLWLAKSLSQHHAPFPLIQYISPTIWAWKAQRLKTMEQVLSHLLYIYPFEKEALQASSLPSSFVGHPILDTLENIQSINSTYLPPQRKVLALFPGSRASEWRMNFPVQFKSALRWLVETRKNSDEWIIAIGATSNADEELTHLLAKLNTTHENPFEVYIVPPAGQNELFLRAIFAIAKSGTITLQLACYGIPSVVMYQVSKSNYFLGKYLFKIKLTHFCIVNILLKQEVFPEFIGSNLSPQLISMALQNIEIRFPDGMSRLLLQEVVRKALCNSKGISPSHYAAQTLIELLHSSLYDN